jgi:UDP-N-acetylmuramate--alanine ligase
MYFTSKQFNNNSKNCQEKIHFIGIGGIGVSALARYYLIKGFKVSGSDLKESEITKALKKLGAKIFIGKQKKKNVPKDADLVIYSPAIEKNNPELLAAKAYNLKTLSYPQALGKLTKKHFTIAVCGSHGKSTVAAMIGLILAKAKFDPTVILGTKLREFGNSNCRVGKSKYLVIEADEYKESFLNYWPKIIVLLNIEYDHPDYFKNLRHYILAFKKFVFHLPKNGILIANKDDKNIYQTFSTIVKNILWYSLKERRAKKLKRILKIPGEFNVSNALAALRVAEILKISKKIALKTLSQFKGTWRRFEIKKAKIDNLKFTIINDYGHHPTQVKETLKAAREKYPKKKIFCIFQPHQYQRTFYLFDDFVRALRGNPIDKVFITDIYTVAGRESKKIMKKVSAKKLVNATKRENVIYLPKREIISYLKKNLKGGEVVILMGAGDIYELSLKIL